MKAGCGEVCTEGMIRHGICIDLFANYVFWRLVKYDLAKSNYHGSQKRDLRDRGVQSGGPPPRMWEWAPQLIHGGPEQKNASKWILCLNKSMALYKRELHVAVFLKQKSSKTSSICIIQSHL